jgi:hypothetical protein
MVAANNFRSPRQTVWRATIYKWLPKRSNFAALAIGVAT